MAHYEGSMFEVVAHPGGLDNIKRERYVNRIEADAAIARHVAAGTNTELYICRWIEQKVALGWYEGKRK